VPTTFEAEAVHDSVGLQQLLDALIGDGRTVIGPTVRDGAIVLGELRTVDDLPQGWRDEQSPGRYRLVDTGSPLRFAHAAPAQAWRRYLQPPRALLWRSETTDGVPRITESDEAPSKYAFLGVRSCDLAALSVSDRTLGAADPRVAGRRADTIVVAVACTHPSGVCFCASTGTGPAPAAGYDLALTELLVDGSPRYLALAGTARGSELLRALPTTRADESDQRAAAAALDQAAASMGRTLDPAAPAAAAAHPEHPHYDDITSRCLSCANCTLVCPTCFCGGAVDTTDLTGQVAERWWQWDSCFSEDFSFMHGGAVRESTRSRYRQWLLHKLVTWEQQFGTGGCVGCGRCIAWCPVGIDLTVEIAALARTPGDDPSPSTASPGGDR
jgi:ferredoxin